jgi:hypothetical protein
VASELNLEYKHFSFENVAHTKHLGETRDKYIEIIEEKIKIAEKELKKSQNKLFLLTNICEAFLTEQSPVSLLIKKIRKSENFLICTSHRPEIIPSFVFGFFTTIFYFPLPDSEDRFSIFKFFFCDAPLKDDIDLQLLAKKTEGFSFDDILISKDNFNHPLFRKARDEISLIRYQKFRESIFYIGNMFKDLEPPRNVNQIVNNFDPAFNSNENDDDLYK